MGAVAECDAAAPNVSREYCPPIVGKPVVAVLTMTVPGNWTGWQEGMRIGWACSANGKVEFHICWRYPALDAGSDILPVPKPN